MFSYLQLPFLQALGYAITNSIWQVFLLWLIVLLVNSTARQSSHVKYVTALCAQVAGFVWFLTTFQFYYHHCLIASAEAEQLANGNTAVYLQNVVRDGNSVLSFLVRTEETLPYLSLAYLLFLLYLIIKWVQSFRFTKSLSASGLETIGGDWQVFVNEMADKMNIMQEVKIYLSSVAKSPLTVGYVKPVVLLPVACVTYLTTEQLEAVILHELAHIKRADYIINLFVSVAEMIMFFNPFTNLLSNAIQKERENCCDDWVLQYQYGAGMYAEALLRIACFQKEGFQMNAAAEQKGQLLQRVKRMIQPSPKKFSYRHQATAMMFIAGLLFCIAWLQPDENDYHKTVAASHQIENKKIVIAPVLAQVDNPFFNGASLFTPSLQDDVAQSLAEWDATVADSVNAAVKETKKTLEKTAPEVMATVSSGNWQRMVKEAMEQAGKEKLNLNIQLSDVDIPKQLFDSAFLLQSIQEVLSKTNGLKDVQIGIESTKEKLENLQQNEALNYGFTFSTNYLNDLCANALASLQNLHFGVIQDSIAAATDRIKKFSFERNKKAQETIARQALLLKQNEERRNKMLATIDKRNARKLPSMPPASQEPSEPEDATTDEPIDSYSVADNVLQPATYNWSFSEKPDGHSDNLSQVKTAKAIHIIRNSDNGTINIVIEIKQ